MNRSPRKESFTKVFFCTLINLLCICTGREYVGPDAQQRVSRETQSNVTKQCSICGGLGGTGILPDTYPSYIPSVDAPAGLSCQDFESRAATLLFDEDGYSPGCVGFAAAFSYQCCDLTAAVAPYECETAVQTKLLGEGSRYNANVAPVPSLDRDVEVTFFLTYYHLTELNIVHGTAEMYFGLDMGWYDKRLRWDPADVGGCTSTTFRASLNVETTEIWVPDFDLHNKFQGVQSLPEAMAVVYADGAVRWRRNGGLGALCALTGLERIPFDTLGCYLDFGPTLVRPGISYEFSVWDNKEGVFISNDHDAKYQEYTLVADLTTAEMFQIDGSLEKMRFTFYYRRAVSYYVAKILIPTILFTLLSFGMFLLDLRVGERLAFGISLLLVIIAQDIVTKDMLPICDELLWIDVLTQMSQYFVIAAVLESLVVAYIYFLDSQDKTKESEAPKAVEQTGSFEGEDTSDLVSTDHLVSGSYSNKESDCVKESGVGVNQGEDTANLVTTDLSVGAGSISNKESDYIKESGRSVNHKNVETPPQKGKRVKLITLRHLLTRSPQLHETRREKIIRIMDRTCLIFLPTSYVVFVITMFARNKYW